MSAYAVSDEVLVYLINQSLNGSDEQRVSASLILFCLRTKGSSEEIAECIDELAAHTILDVAGNARSMAANLGLISVTANS